MFDTNKLYLFISAALLLNITPGADMLYVIARSLSNGIKGGIVSSLGIAVGCLIHILLAILGLSALISNSSLAFEIVKYLGASYLIFLGLKLLIQKNERLNFTNLKLNENRKLSSIFKQGIITNVLNPKVILFFLAFLPQFVNKELPNINIQLLFLGFFFTTSGTIVNIIVASIIGTISIRLRDYPKLWLIQEKVSGLLIIAIGLKLAIMNQK
jgi:threonine/homoserine/homoserine lactone efflux protein